MPKLEVGQVMEREAQAQARKDDWRSVYEDCYEFALPQRNLYSGYYEGGVSGKNKMARVFDSTAIHATQRFANRIQAGLFPPRPNPSWINTQQPCSKHYVRQTLTWQWGSSCWISLLARRL
jgi:hypothetical protein